MDVSVAHLGPTGTNTEAAAAAYAQWLLQTHQNSAYLCAYPSIAQTLKAVAQKQTTLAIVPVENSTEGGVGITLDTVWQLDGLHIQQELVLPITHGLISRGTSVTNIKTVFSHPQALAQCQKWLEKELPAVQLIPTNSTTEAIWDIQQDPTAAAIASPRAAQIYNTPILVPDIHDCPDNCTRFWVMSLAPSATGQWLSLGFSVPENVPGALVKPLEIFARRHINLRRIESRPTKLSLGDYIFFLDLESATDPVAVQDALTELARHTKLLKIFGSYPIIPISSLQ
jgi:prephenate dehydratase